MNNRSEERIMVRLREIRERRWQIGLLSCLCLLVAIGVAGFFRLPATAKTYQKWVLTCPAEAPAGPGYAGFFLHTHNDDCLDENGNLVCPLPEIKAHVHDENCFVVSRELDCAIPESDGHQHTAECYTRVRGDLTCALSTEPVLDEEGNVLEEGHVHTDECYAWHEELTCGMEAGEGAHHHDENCYRTVTTLTCDKAEIIPHVHTDACYTVDEAGNASLICGLQELTEHVHGPECFTVYELDDGVPEETEETSVVTAESESETETVTVTEIETETVTEVTPAAENTEETEDGFIFLYPEENETEIEAETWISTEDSDTDNTDPENVDPENADEARTAERETTVTEAADEENTEQESQEADPADSQETEEKENTEEDKEENSADKETAEGEQETEEKQETEETSEAIPCVQLGGEKDGATVLAEVPESILGEIARLSFSDYSADEARAAILSAVNENAAEGEEREITALYVIDIGLDVNGEPVIPEGETPIRFTIRAKEICGMSAPKVYQLMNGTAERIKEADFDLEAGTVSFTASSFSPFAVVDLTGDETAEEPASVSMPAQSFSGETEDVVVSVTAPEGAFPEGTTMEVRTVEVDDETMSSVESAVEGRITSVQAVDITFFDADGNKIEPQTAIQVSMKSAVVSQSENVSLIHKPDAPEAADAEAEAPGLELMEAAIVEQEDTAAPSDEITFESDAFSVYMLVGTETITTNYITADGETYTITVTYGADAMIPQGATLAVTEIPQDSEEYAAFLDQAKTAVNAGAASTDAGETAEVTEVTVETAEETDGAVETASTESGSEPAGRVTVTTARFFDITILDAEGNPVEPAAPLDVKIEYAEPAETAENYQVVHFGEETEVLNPAVSGADGSASAFDFQTSSFSVFGVVGTKVITMDYITASGETYTITVTYGPEAGIPEGTELNVVEYSEDDVLFHECYSDREKWIETAAENSGDSAQKGSPLGNLEDLTFEQGFGDAVNYDIDGELSDEDKARAVSLMRASGTRTISGYILFDISLIYEGTEIEPLAPVQVTIRSANPELQEYDDISVGHYVEEPTDTSRSMETIKELSFSSDNREENAQLIVDFETASFSLYDVTGIKWTANESKTVYFALKTGINKVLDMDQNGTIPVTYSQIETMEPSAVSAYIQSLPDYATAEPIIIYDKSGTDFYAIDGNGNLAQVYESGDMVLWNNKPSIGWKLIRYKNDDGEYTGYYDFINMETGKFLAPQAAQTISDNRIGVQLDGAAGHNTTIKAWDSSVNAYCGYSIQNNQLVTSESKEWYFASVSQTVSDDLKLQTVETVDSTALGVTIKMFNYPNTIIKNNRSKYQYDYHIFINKEVEDWLSDGAVIQGLVKNTLNGNGFPVATYGNNDLDELFTGSNQVTATDANHLFIQQTYDETGYFEYSSFENFAHLGADGDFTVYRQVGVGNTARTSPSQNTVKTYGNSTNYYFNRGNFLPYNTIADYQTATKTHGSTGVTNKYDENGNDLTAENPRNGEALFLAQQDVDYFFGMSMEANFYQPVDGKNNGEDVIYEFNGDDDLWVFIDNVLVLDIGGCHHAHSGSINFSTGKVSVETGRGPETTTIRQCFEDAGIFPDGTTWNDNKVNQYFSGDTFADYSQHNMKMFYMERGAGASNLHIKFNLPVIKDAGKLIVDKVVSGTVNQKYSNDKFPFQVIRVDGNTETRFAEAVYESDGKPVEYQHQVEINGTTYEDVFYLRPGEAAVFDVADNTQQYYVKELGIDTDYYDRVLINREQATVTGGIAESSVSTVKNRNRVTYDNQGVTENLKITKTVEGNVTSPSDMFEFYVYLTGPNNELIPYSNGDYYVLDPKGYYCTYVDGLPVGDASITDATRTAYHSGQWGTIGSIPAGYTVLIPDLLVGTDFMVSERMDNIPEGYEFKSIVVEAGTAETVDITAYSNVTEGADDSITIGSYSYSNHREGTLKKDAASDATVKVTNQAANRLTVNKVWQASDYVTEHGPVKFALYKLVDGKEVFVEKSVKTLAPGVTSIEYQITGSIADYVVREVVVATNGNETTVTPVADKGVIEVSGETTKLGTNKTDSYIVTYRKGTAEGSSRTDTVTNTMPQLTVNKKNMNGSQLADAEFKLTGEDGETALTGYGNLKSDTKESGNLLDGIYLSNGTYYLVETKAPDGFNLLAYKVKIVVSGDNASRIFTVSTDPESTTNIPDKTSSDNMQYIFNVYNNPGVELPQTGGTGTALFTVLGGIMTATAGAILTLRKRKGHA